MRLLLSQYIKTNKIQIVFKFLIIENILENF